ncbi:MAG: TldD/PmbA family protein [Acidimicrobiia bacterium]
MADRTTELLGIARRIAADARGPEQVEAYVLRARDLDVRVFDAEVESLSVAETAGIGVRVVIDGRQGYAWTGSLDEALVAEALAEARDNAAFAEPDDANGLVDPAEFGGTAVADLDLWREGLFAVPADDKVGIALALDAATRAVDPRVRGLEESSYGEVSAEAAIVNSLGVEAVTRRTACSCSAAALAGEGGATQTGYGFSVGREPGDLDVEAAAKDAARRAVNLLGATQPRSARLPAVLDPLVTSSFLSIIGGALNGESIAKGRSFFVGREGEEVANGTVTILDDPTDARAYGAAPFDAEGAPTRPTTLISGGVLRGFLHNRASARRAGASSTASAVRAGYKSTPGVGARALGLQPGPLDRDGVLRSVGDGLYVQSVSGLHSGVNTVSGDFSVGAEGFLIRHGELAEPVREITIASTIPRMLLDVHHVGADVRWLPGNAAGMTLAIREMSMGGA